MASLWWLASALFIPFAIVLLLVLQTVSTEADRRSVEARVLTDYATIAVREVAVRAEDALHMEELHSAFRAVGHPAGEGADPAALLTRDARPNGSLVGREAVRAFRYETGSGELTLRGSAVDRSRETALRDIAVRLSADTVQEPHRLVVDDSLLPGSALWILIDRPMGMSGQPGAGPRHVRRIYGIETPLGTVGRLVASALNDNVLPPGLLAPPYSPEALRLVVRDSRGSAVWQNVTDHGIAAPVSDTLGTHLGGIILEIQAGPGLASVLRIGRPSALYLPALFVVLALSAALGMLGLVQLRRAREIAELRERFVANVSHELRTPLTQMSMFAEMLQHSRVRSEAEARHYASVIHRETRRLTTLVESVLRFSRNQRGAIALHPEPCDLAGEIVDAVEFFRPVAAGKEVQVVVEAAPDVAVKVDPSAFRQVMLNILDNAVKYGPAGQRVIITASSRGEEAAVTVTDEGPGIVAADRQRVFEPYVRLHPPTAPRAAGAGIGMAVVRDLVTALGGRIWIGDAESGAAVTFTVPVHEPAPAMPAETAAMARP